MHDLTDNPVNEDFVHFFSGELLDLADAIDTPGIVHDRLRDALLAILNEGLLPAFNYLRKIRASVSEPLPELARKQFYEDFSRALWHAYKDLMPAAASLLGFDLGFIFQKENVFKKRLIDFRLEHDTLLAPNLGEFIRRQRGAWQNDMARFQNHSIEYREEDKIKFAAFYEPENAEMLFALVWGVMANMLPVFIEANYMGKTSIEEIPVAERDPIERKRFRYVTRKAERR